MPDTLRLLLPFRQCGFHWPPVAAADDIRLRRLLCPHLLPRRSGDWPCIADADWHPPPPGLNGRSKAAFRRDFSLAGSIKIPPPPLPPPGLNGRSKAAFRRDFSLAGSIKIPPPPLPPCGGAAGSSAQYGAHRRQPDGKRRRQKKVF